MLRSRKTGGPARGWRRTDARVALVFDEGRETEKVDSVLSGKTKVERVTKEITHEGPCKNRTRGGRVGRGKVCIFFSRGDKTGG